MTAYEEESELQNCYLRFDIDLLARRIAGMFEWLELQPYAYGPNKGLFALNTGAAAPIASAEILDRIDAIVSRGRGPDLAGKALQNVEPPTLLIVGGNDQDVIDLNEQALQNMPPEGYKKLIVVPGASHLFEEAGALEEAAQLARDWFQRYLDGVGVR